MEVLYCGVRHSDLHQVRNDWGGSNYPLVPGHEIIGRVIETGPDVHRFKAGDAVAVGCLVDSCQGCDQCRKGLEQRCRKRATQTYNDKDRITREPTYGGYSRHLVAREEFVLRVPDGLDLARAAPLLCAGITTYSPLRHRKVGPGSRVGVTGLGGLGHMAVKLAAALGADRLLISSDADRMARATNGFDLMIDTVPVRHDLTPYLPLLDVDGTLVMVGQIGPLPETTSVPLVSGRRSISGCPSRASPRRRKCSISARARTFFPTSR